MKSPDLAVLKTNLIEVRAAHLWNYAHGCESREAALQGVNWMERGFPLKTAAVNGFQSFLKLVTEAFKRMKPPYLLQHGGTSKSVCKMRAAGHKRSSIIRFLL